MTLGPKYDGIRVDASGILTRRSKGGSFMRSEMHRNLEAMAARYYAGDVVAVDEFCQLYCLDKARPK